MQLLHLYLFKLLLLLWIYEFTPGNCYYPGHCKLLCYTHVHIQWIVTHRMLLNISASVHMYVRVLILIITDNMCIVSVINIKPFRINKTIVWISFCCHSNVPLITFCFFKTPFEEAAVLAFKSGKPNWNEMLLWWGKQSM